MGIVRVPVMATLPAAEPEIMPMSRLKIIAVLAVAATNFCVTAVSYTHLDVYKRQTQLCARLGADARPPSEAAADAEKRAQAAARAARGARSPKDARALSAGLLKAFHLCEDAFTRLDWHDAVIFPHEYAQTNLSFLLKARESLCAGDTAAACDALCACLLYTSRCV